MAVNSRMGAAVVAAVAMSLLSAAGLSFVAPTAGKATPSQSEVSVHSQGPLAAAAAAVTPSAPGATAGVALLGASAALALLARGALAGSARKPSPSTAARREVVSMGAFESELGVQAPVGFWDPAGLSKDGDAAAFKRRRSTEIKHGRVSMLATMGYITPEVAGKFPGFLSPSKGLAFEDIPNGLAAISKVPALGWIQIVIYCLYVEASGLGFDYIGQGEKTPGDVGWKPPLLSGFDGEAKTKKLNAEIANGRLAMVAIIGMFFQDGLTGSAWGDWANYTDSPLRAFESELGVQAPVGYWDPAGLSRDGDSEAFKRRRVTEIKHGRVSMFACLGYITPEYFKWPGYCSPSKGVAFADIPNGLAALSKVPGAGWVQIFLFAGLIEKGLYPYDPSRAPGDYENGGVLGVPNGSTLPAGELKSRKLNAEIANGRLAMMAIIGMFYQDGLTGSAWGDWELYTDSPLRAFESELGVQAPVGFWDPAGLSKDGDAAAFKRRRSTEIKHGRVSMLATMGYITPEVAGKFPGFLSPSKGLAFEDIPNGLAAISKVPALGWIQIVIYCLYVEASGLGFDYIGQGEKTPGDVGWKPPLLSGFDGEAKTKKLNAEIANGRLAMVAIIGMFFQDGLTGSAWGDWANYTDSPLRAFESELGVQAPVGYWDPAGLSRDGDSEAFKRRRVTEIKHGRVSMFACLGYITPEYFKWPGYCSPSKGVAFADIPNGLAALSKVPGAGWVQIFLFAGLIEKGLYPYDPSRAPGDYENGGVLGVPNGSTLPAGELKSRKLNAEIANGRLAMMAIIGMFYQDGLTGSAWGDWELYTDSPLRAFENELGVQAPLGYWDPLGLAADGDVDTYTRRRVTEIKHGRVSMLATIGYIVPEYAKWPGMLSPSQGLRFEDVPNGLAALSKVPTSGWLQIVLFAGSRELFTYDGNTPYNKSAAPGDLGWKAITSTDPEIKTRKLNAEIANGRLAMMAIIGMLYQDGLTGSAWGDWALYTDSPLRAR